jgi:hypothetical protein
MEAHKIEKKNLIFTREIINNWNDKTPIIINDNKIKLSLQLQFELPFKICYKKIIHIIKNGNILTHKTSNYKICNVRSNLPCGSGFMFVIEHLIYKKFSFTVYSSGKIQVRGSGNIKIINTLKKISKDIYNILCNKRIFIESIEAIE